MKDLPLAKQERDQQPPHAPIAVDEGVDRLELGVSESTMHEDGKGSRVVEERFEVVQCRLQLMDRRRDEDGGIEVTAARGPDPVLGGAELAGGLLAAAHSPEQAIVDLADQPQAER
jgi:hypothetical protein